MATDRIPMLFFFLLIHFQFSQAALHFSSSFPISEILSSSRANVSLSHMLQDVVEVISASGNWNVEDVRVSEVQEARYSIAQFYEFSVELDDNHFGPISFSDDFGSWRKFRKPKSDFYSLVNDTNSLAVMDTLEIEGPVELWVDHPHRFSLSLPNNICHVDLNRILVVEGITLQVRKASEVYLSYSSSYNLNVLFEELEYSAYRPYMSSSSKLIQLVGVHIRGTASVAAHVTGIPRMPVDTSPISDDAILLHPRDMDNPNLPSAYQCRNKRWCPSESDPLSMRLSMGHKIWRILLGNGRLPRHLSPLSVSFYAHRKAVAAVKFSIVLERDIGIIEKRDDWISYGDEPLWDLLSNSPQKRKEVRTVECVRFEVEATVEADLRLNPISFQETNGAIIYRQDTNSTNNFPTTCYI
ncbi:hypothetical protein QN277_014769 [Acacia crassicarpa]|uniref:Uncharacterized protein n=1 Tax=Acacia crassicarpa TaxID=499986 RepID=A0AAE1JZ39_9FABA|nr:hypothetical protein QN277_014769 [Acacia crassicarpa]